MYGAINIVLIPDVQPNKAIDDITNANRTNSAPFVLFIQEYTMTHNNISTTLSENSISPVIWFVDLPVRAHDVPNKMYKQNHTIPNTYPGGRAGMADPLSLDIGQLVLIIIPNISGVRNLATVTTLLTLFAGLYKSEKCTLVAISDCF